MAVRSYCFAQFDRWPLGTDTLPHFGARHVTDFRTFTTYRTLSVRKKYDLENHILSNKKELKPVTGLYIGLSRHYGKEAVEYRKTKLYDFHVQLNGKMVPFGGYLLPVSYGAEGISASHLHTRQHCSVFDVSHMMQTEVRGRDKLAFLESLTTADLINMADNTATLTVFTDPLTGGILDDLIITKTTLGYYHLVSNAARRPQDQKLLEEAQAAMRAKGKDVDIRFLNPEERALLAVQGPDTAKVLQPLTDVDLSRLYFMESTLATVAGVSDCRITRCGYTGEDGVEISLAADQAVKVAELLLASEVASVKPAGLGARDSLRLEAGMCLYGNDIDHTTTPVEAGLSWLVAKRRRTTADFPGATVIIDQLRNGPGRRRVGLKSRGPPARAGAAVHALTDTLHEDIVGYITSGCPSPSLGGNIAMGYVRSELAKSGTKVLLKVREKRVEATVCKLPFVPSKYYVRQTM